MQTIETIKLLSMFLGANGLWKVIEYLLKIKVEKRKHDEQINNLKAQTSNLMLENWIEWSTRLENRVKELESRLSEMGQEIESKNLQLHEKDIQIEKLESQLEICEANNQTLTNKLSLYE